MVLVLLMVGTTLALLPLNEWMLAVESFSQLESISPEPHRT